MWIRIHSYKLFCQEAFTKLKWSEEVKWVKSILIESNYIWLHSHKLNTLTGKIFFHFRSNVKWNKTQTNQSELNQIKPSQTENVQMVSQS